MGTTGEVPRVAKNEIARLRTSGRLTTDEIHLMRGLVVNAFTQITTVQRRNGG